MADVISSGNGEYRYNTGTFGRPITTSNPHAQRWFNRGLTWAYAFNQKEAIACFEQAIAHDGSCAMAYWGLAFVSGPHYNQPWEAFGDQLPSVVKRTYDASRKAASFAATSTAIENALITAIQARFQSDTPADNIEQYAVQNKAYADAMQAVYRDFGADLDVATLYADAIMSLTAWKLWDLVSGEPNPGTRTVEAKEVLEAALNQKDGFKHPGLLHTYIHLIEMSPTPELGLPAANSLRELVPDSGHLQHMPAHLDVLVGDYAAAIKANELATMADEKYFHAEGGANFYSIYRMHNYHTLIYAAMFAGQKKVALDAVHRMESTLPRDVLEHMADYLEVFMGVRAHVMVRFGMWEEIIQLPVPGPEDQALLCVTTATVYYAKGVALAATGNVAEAQKYRDLYIAALKRVPDTRLDFPNKCINILAVGAAMLDGEIEYRRGNYGKAFERLRQSEELDDGLDYSEPWPWMQPARHALAALLLEQNRVHEAAQVYREDLGLDESVVRARRHPNNVWALQGYHECLVRLGRAEEAAEIEPRLEAALSVTDVAVKSSCFCRRDTSQVPGGCC